MKVVSNWKTTLSASITSSQTTIPVTSIQTSDNTAHTIAASDIDSFGYMVIEPGSTRVEIIKFTGISSNGDGSGTLTGVTRGLAFYGGTETAVTANGKAHNSGSTIMMSNVHYFYDKLVDTDQTETVAGVKTFSSLPTTTAGNPVAANDLARKSYVDTTATGTTVIAAIVIPGLAGETIADGDLIYFDTVTNLEWMKCDADTAASVENALLGIAQGAGTNGNTITNGVLIFGLDDAQSGMTAGNIMYASNTAGDISSTAGTKEVTVGIARSGTVLYFYPRFNQQITEDEQDALAGSSGTPSTSNKFITADDVSAAGGSGKIIRAVATTIASGIHVPIEQLKREGSKGTIIVRTAQEFTTIAVGADGAFLVATAVTASGVAWSAAPDVIRWQYMSSVSGTSITVPSGALAAIVALQADDNAAPDGILKGEVTIFATGKTSGTIQEGKSTSLNVPTVSASWSGSTISITGTNDPTGTAYFFR